MSPSLVTPPPGLTITLPTYKFSAAPASNRLLETNSVVCPVKAAINLSNLRPHLDGPFFIDQSCDPYRRENATRILKNAIKSFFRNLIDILFLLYCLLNIF